MRAVRAKWSPMPPVRIRRRKRDKTGRRPQPIDAAAFASLMPLLPLEGASVAADCSPPSSTRRALGDQTGNRPATSTDSDSEPLAIAACIASPESVDWPSLARCVDLL